MEKELEFLYQLTPELRDILHLRYKIMANISFLQPVGRRMLASKLDIKERRLRNELEFLKDKQFIQISSNGMYLTRRGEEMVNRGREFIRTLSGLSELENQLQNLLKLKEVLIVPGDSCEDEVVKQEIGGTAAKIFVKLLESRSNIIPGEKRMVSGGDEEIAEGGKTGKRIFHRNEEVVVALTGGSTLAAMSEMLPDYSDNFNKKKVTIVPARGGLGEKVEHQANTIAAVVANKLGCSYRMLHVPEELSTKTVKSLLSEPKIKDILDLIKKSHILIHGIGRAEVMAKRRGSSNKELKLLKEKGAIGEAFGFYLDEKGQVIEKITTVGLTLDDLDEIPTVVAVAGGSDKAEAILAMMATKHNDVLVTDEGAARKMVDLLNSSS